MSRTYLDFGFAMCAPVRGISPSCSRAARRSHSQDGGGHRVLRLLIGLVKGAVVGGAVGYGAYYLGLGGAFHWITYGVIGALVGLLCGRPFWSHLLDKSS